MEKAAITIIRLFTVLASLSMMAVFGAVTLIALTGSADISGFERKSALVVGIAPIPWLVLLMRKAIWFQKPIPSSAFVAAMMYSIVLALCSLIRLGYDQDGLSGNLQRLRIEMEAILTCPLLWGLYKAALIVKRVVSTKTAMRAGRQTDSSLRSAK